MKTMTLQIPTPGQIRELDRQGRIISVGSCCGEVDGCEPILNALSDKQVRKSLLGMAHSWNWRGQRAILEFLKKNFRYTPVDSECGQGHRYTEYLFILDSEPGELTCLLPRKKEVWIPEPKVNSFDEFCRYWNVG